MRRATDEEKNKARRWHEGGVSYKAIARLIGYSHVAIMYWMKPEMRERTNERKRLWRLDNPERGRIHYQKWYRSESGKEYLRNNIYKNGVRQITNDAIRAGKLIKQPCEVCGEDKVHAHHLDYSKPLEVMWLCDKHHREWHKKHGNKHYR